MKAGLKLKIKLHEIPVKDVAQDFSDTPDNGATGYSGRLDIRPAFQREFIYKEKQRNAVIETVLHGFPLNVMYWSKVKEDTYEMLDGQQRTISLCSYINGDYSISMDGMPRKFSNLTPDEQNAILNYPLMIYICEGTDKDKLDWFKTININGERLNTQEMRNAIYAGKWLTEAKKHFSKLQCPAHLIASDYLSGSSIHQQYLEVALKWIADRDNISLEEYMSIHQNDTNCNDLWLYFQSVINWTKATFSVQRKKLMKGLDWGIIYNNHKNDKLDPNLLEDRILKLLDDEDVTNQKGIYEYVLDGKEKHLHIRAFSPKMARTAYERQKGVCPACLKQFKIEEMEADHITPWSAGGPTTADNCQMLCRECNRRKGSK